jgi:hypothetical protein
MAKFTEQQAIEFTQVSDWTILHNDTDADTDHTISGTYNLTPYSFPWPSAFTELEWTMEDVVTFIQTQDI